MQALRFYIFNHGSTGGSWPAPKSTASRRLDSCEPYRSEVHFPIEYLRIGPMFVMIGSVPIFPLGFGKLLEVKQLRGFRCWQTIKSEF